MYEFHDYLLNNPSDPLTSSGLRYLGFVNDVGEACKAFLPKPLYYGSYAITGGYGLTAVLYSRARFQQQLIKDNVAPEKHASLLMRETIDTSLWHLFATFMVTPYLIHQSKKVSIAALAKTSMSQAMKTKILPSAIGLGLIPVLVPPIDNFFHWTLNNLYREAHEQRGYSWHGIYSSMNKEEHKDEKKNE